MFINEERKGSLLAWGLGQIIRSWARTDGRGGGSSGVGREKQVDQVPAPVTHGCRSLLGNVRTKWDPTLMTFRCAGRAAQPQGNQTGARADAPGLPR